MKKRILRLLSCLLLAAALFSAPSLPAAAAGADISKDEIEYYVIPYVIRKGDTLAHVYWLWGLRYENYAEDIRSLNGVENLDLLYIGAIYLLPTTASNLQTETYTTVWAHTMKSGETAYDVCTAYGIDYFDLLPRLRSYNQGRDLTKLRVGETLLIPIPNE